MKEYSAQDIRNVVLLGATKSGKTTLAETMLFEGKVIDRRGTVEDKNTVSDFDDLEKLNQRSIYATPVYAEYQGKKINILDAPGSDDFIGGAYAGFRVCENGLLVMNAQQGIEVGTRNALRYADQYKLPLIVAVNHLDGEKADWDLAQHALKEALGSKYLALQFPTGTGVDFNGIVDVLTMKYNDNQDIPAAFADKAEEARMALIEKVAEFDDALMEKFFEEGTLSEEEIINGLAIGIKNREVYPVLCVSGKKDLGVKRLLEFIANSAVAPKVDEKGAAGLFIYKNNVEHHLGEVSYFKVMSGAVTAGLDLENPETGDKERLSAIYAVAGTKKEPVQVLKAGDFGCAVKLKNGKSNTTLSAIGSNLNFDKIQYPAPKYRCAIKAKVQQDEQKLGEALKKISSQDPTVIVEYSKELRQTILRSPSRSWNWSWVL